MRILFAGTPHFAERALSALIAAGYALPLVLTQPDRRAGRGMNHAASPVKRLALEHGLEVFQPPNLRERGVVERLRETAPEALVVAAYGLILPQDVLDLPRLGALNIHASLLPRWRGAAPIQRAILAGDSQTGITIMQMDAGLDTGAMLAQRSIAVLDEDDASSLHDHLASLGAEMIVQVLRDVELGVARATPQPVQGVTYADKIVKAEARLDWSKSAAELDRAVRAFYLFPGAHAMLGGAMVKIWRARRGEGSGPPGSVLACGNDGIRVACGHGALILTELQRAGAKRVSAAGFLQSQAIDQGVRFA